ncbi:MAG: Holliday junction helicase RuvA, holliday junction helicase RuvA [Candidatus Parcubacteria bacterium]|jgi:Holliday junction DNA helicase RuvA
MIYAITGEVIQKTDKYLAITTTSGVSYKIFCSAKMLANITAGITTTVYTYMSVGEDKLDLFGFLIPSDLELFEQLVSVSGVGPKSALSILDIAETKSIAAAIVAGRADIISQASGIGSKTAQKIIVELKSKAIVIEAASGGVVETDTREVYEALESLGYQRNQIRSIVDDIEKGLSVEEKIKRALKALGKQKK